METKGAVQRDDVIGVDLGSNGARDDNGAMKDAFKPYVEVVGGKGGC